MSKSSALILLGILTILTPFSGVPMVFRSFVAIVLGAIVISIGVSMRTRKE